MEKQEVWKPIPGYEGYEVSNKGRARSYFARAGSHAWIIADVPQRILKPGKEPSGYPGINLRKDNISHYKRIHQLVLLAFVGPCPNGLMVCHNNDIPDDNRLENLRYDTLSENLRDVVRNGNRKLSIEDIKNIRHRRAECESCIQIARDYGCLPGMIRAIAGGKTYKYINAGGVLTNDNRRKLTPVQVSIIKRLLLNKVVRREIAKRFGVSPSMITLIAKGARWTHVVPAVVI